ncbi:chitin deacetylase CDA4 [Aspergillus saccharolyticus JOP 1030-1]|uniref:chitin deacetylase n=1 Tax=Aspergillus saccharolyticus JOP 1030-1 TaxID=1450539 RepID=A0A318ZRT3_9EURO|nr:glycoside hydrolase/deacetylase [Aspergillus saccharolyticus JOP 1030-1]PYH42798.1 glycoside hydrolase/deacetylase [Aspergillus saccharolyticus JOP 1030-1]
MPRLHLTNHLNRLLTLLLTTLPTPLTTFLPSRLRTYTHRTRARARSRALSRPHPPPPPPYQYNDLKPYKDKKHPFPNTNHPCRNPPNQYYLRLRHLLKMTLVTLLLLTLFLTLLPAYTIYRPPSLLIRYLQHRYPDVLFHVPLPPSAPKTIALTIDDSPSTFTPEILGLLEQYEARATFFVIGAQIAAPRGQEILQEMVRAGMELGNHAMSDRPSLELSDAVLEAEVVGVQGWLDRIEWQVFPSPEEEDDDEREDREELGGGRRQQQQQQQRKYKWFRPGSGFFSDRMRAIIQKLGMRIALGSVYPHDAQIDWPRLNAWHILSMVRSGSVIVCHDRRGWTVPMLKRVLPELKRRGYRVVTLSELVELGEQGLHLEL